MGVFISYSSKDSQRVVQFAKRIQGQNLTVWLDEWNIVPGDQISQAIEHGLDKSEFVIFMLSSNSVNSGWADKEWRTKLDDELAAKAVKVICVRLDDCAIPKLLSGKKYIDALKNNDKDVADEVVRAIQSHRSRRLLKPTEEWLDTTASKHTPVALIRIRDSAILAQSSMSAAQAIKFLEAETDFILDECRRNMVPGERLDSSDEIQDGLAALGEILMGVAKGNAEANLREMETWKGYLDFYLGRSELSPENLLPYLMIRLDKYIEEASQ